MAETLNGSAFFLEEVASWLGAAEGVPVLPIKSVLDSVDSAENAATLLVLEEVLREARKVIVDFGYCGMKVWGCL
jgi:hypothetical protein